MTAQIICLRPPPPRHEPARGLLVAWLLVMPLWGAIALWWVA